MPTTYKSSSNPSSNTATHNSIPMLSWSRRSTVSTSLHTRLYRQEMSTANHTAANSATNNTIPLLSRLNRSEMSTANYSSANTATNNSVQVLPWFI